MAALFLFIFLKIDQVSDNLTAAVIENLLAVNFSFPWGLLSTQEKSTEFSLFPVVLKDGGDAAVKVLEVTPKSLFLGLILNAVLQ